MSDRRKELEKLYNESVMMGRLRTGEPMTHMVDGALKMIREATSVTEAVKTVRNVDLLCETCFARAGSRWGGAAMTTWECAKCKGHHLAGSTAHESICKDCAIAYGICQWCGHNKHMYQEEAK